MPTERKLKANRRNAQRSTGPRDTTRSRFNALKHGILSREVLVSTEEGSEEENVFEGFDSALRDALAPEGALEELLVENLIMLAWRWRRVIRAETATIRLRSDLESGKRHRASLAQEAKPIRDLTAEVEGLEEELNDLENQDPLQIRPSLSYRVAQTAEWHFNLDLDSLFEIEEDDSWELRDFSTEDAELVISTTCERAGTSQGEFWNRVKARVQAEYEEEYSNLERCRPVVPRKHDPTVILPDDKKLENIIRYEAHISPQFHRMLHELQRIQVARLGHQPSAPVAVDINIDTDRSE